MIALKIRTQMKSIKFVKLLIMKEVRRKEVI